MEIQHFGHRHPLSLVDNFKLRIILCHACMRRVSGPTYVCRTCRGVFHKYCIDELKPEVQCFSHPCPIVLFNWDHRTCHVCNDSYDFVALGYECKSCGFDIHVGCALKAMAKYSEENSSLHFTHHHPLKPVTFKEQKDVSVTEGYRVCGICAQLIRYSSPTYGCIECMFFLHKSCMQSFSGRLTNHLIHPCTLVVRCYPVVRVFEVDDVYKCAKCGEIKPFILSFNCEPCGFYMHVKCALLSNTESKDAKEIKHFSHPHPLELIQNHQAYENQPNCVACLQACLPTTPTFKCSESSCTNFFLHRSCAINFPHNPLLHNHPCHPKHKLAITAIPYNHHIPIPSPTCGACCLGIGVDSSLFAYTCTTDGCEFTLHLDCGKLAASFVCNGHPHRLILIEKTPGFPCHACGVNCSTFVLRCVPCNFNIHLQCLPSAPKTITHKSHLHSLVLTTKTPLPHELNSEEDAYNSEDEFYCDVCEQKRYKRDPVYYCAECKFIAELKCVVKEVLQLIPRCNLLVQQVDDDNDENSNDDDNDHDSRWKISKMLYEVEKLEQMKIELENRLEIMTRDLLKAKNMLEKFVAEAHK